MVRWVFLKKNLNLIFLKFNDLNRDIFLKKNDFYFNYFLKNELKINNISNIIFKQVQLYWLFFLKNNEIYKNKLKAESNLLDMNKILENQFNTNRKKLYKQFFFKHQLTNIFQKNLIIKKLKINTFFKKNNKINICYF